MAVSTAVPPPANHRLIRRRPPPAGGTPACWSSSRCKPSLQPRARPCGVRHFHGRQRSSVNLRLPTVAAAGWPHHSNTVPTPATATILVQSDVERVSERPIVLQEGRVGAARGRRLGGGNGSRHAAQRRSARAARGDLRLAGGLRPLQAAAALPSASQGRTSGQPLAGWCFAAPLSGGVQQAQRGVGMCRSGTSVRSDAGRGEEMAPLCAAPAACGRSWSQTGCSSPPLPAPYCRSGAGLSHMDRSRQLASQAWRAGQRGRLGSLKRAEGLRAVYSSEQSRLQATVPDPCLPAGLQAEPALARVMERAQPA